MIYFDNAATTGKKPLGVIRGVNDALKSYCANPGRSGHSLSIKTSEAVFKAREKLSGFFGADGPENVVFTANCTQSINFVIKGLLKKGDHCIISSLEHNAVVRPLVKTGIAFSKAQVSLKDDRQTAESFARLIKPNTKLIICTGASNVLGKTLPIEEIGRLCREKGIFFAVDAAQTAGILPLNMKKQHIDFLCIAPHKGLYAPMGIGVLIARKPLPFTVIEGGTGTNSAELFQPSVMPERLESGTLNVPAVLGVLSGVEFVEQKGIGRLYDGEWQLISRLYGFLKGIPEIELYTPDFNKNMYVPVLSFNIKGVPSEETVRSFSNEGIALRGGLHCAPLAHSEMGTLQQGAVRISVSAFNNMREIEEFKEKTEKILKSVKISY